MKTKLLLSILLSIALNCIGQKNNNGVYNETSKEWVMVPGYVLDNIPESESWGYRDSGLMMSNKIFSLTNGGTFMAHIDSLIPEISNSEDNFMVVKTPIAFSNCIFKEGTKSNGNYWGRARKKYKFLKGIRYYGCKFENHEQWALNSIERIYGGITFDSCELINMMPSQLNSCHLYFNKCKILSQFLIQGVRNSSLTLTNNYVYWVMINGSTISPVYLSNNGNEFVIYDFQNDSIGNIIITRDRGKEEQQILKKGQTSFKNCFIDGQVYVDLSASVSAIYFEDCNFGSQISFKGLKVDTIGFKNCKFSSNKIKFITEGNAGKHTVLKIENTSLDNLDFNYSKSLKLFVFPDTGSFKSTNQENFENLLAKFEREHKDDSYQRLEIEYRKYKNPPWKNFISRAWWYYGYKKDWILWWTLGFFGFFLGINLVRWKKIPQFYHLTIGVKRMSTIRKSSLPFKVWTAMLNAIRVFVAIFIFTALIFFSIKIDFKILKNQHTLLRVYYFLHYSLGVVCLFFLVNYILKF